MVSKQALDYLKKQYGIEEFPYDISDQQLKYCIRDKGGTKESLLKEAGEYDRLMKEYRRLTEECCTYD